MKAAYQPVSACMVEHFERERGGGAEERMASYLSSYIPIQVRARHTASS